MAGKKGGVRAWLVNGVWAIGSFSKRMVGSPERKWGRKTPEKRKRDRAIEHCQERHLKGFGQEKSLSIGWMKESKQLAWNTPWAADMIAGSMENAKKRGLRYVEARVRGRFTLVEVDEAIKAIRAAGKGQHYEYARGREK